MVRDRMRKAYIPLFLFFCMFSTTLSLSASDIFVSLDSNYADIGSGYAEFTLKNPTSIDVTINLAKFNFKIQSNNTPTTSQKIFILKNISHTIPKYSSIYIAQNCTNLNLTVSNCSYWQTIENGTKTEWRLDWVSLGTETFKAGQQYRFRVEAIWKPKMSVYRDWLPFINISGITYSRQDWAWWNTTFLYRMPIILNNTNNADTLIDYMVNINVSYNTHMVAAFNDLRFTWTNSSNPSSELELNYWIQSKVDSNYANIWLKIPTINGSKNNTMYMYYGNPAVDPVSTSTILNGTCNTTNKFNQTWGITGSDSSYSGYPNTNLNDLTLNSWISTETSAVHWANITIPSSRLCRVDVNLGNQYQTTTGYELRMRYGAPTQVLFFNNTSPISSPDSSWAGNNTHWIYTDGITDVMVWRAPEWSTGARPLLFDIHEIFGYERIYSLPEPNLLLGTEEQPSNSTLIALNYPDNNTKNTTTRNIQFNFTPTFYGGNIVNCSLWHNYSGIWQWTKANQSAIVNGTSQVISYDFADDKNLIIWSIGCWDQTMQNFSDNRTLNISLIRHTNITLIIMPTTAYYKDTIQIAVYVEDYENATKYNVTTGELNMTYIAPVVGREKSLSFYDGAWRTNITLDDIGLWELTFVFRNESSYYSSNDTRIMTILPSQITTGGPTPTPATPTPAIAGGEGILPTREFNFETISAWFTPTNTLISIIFVVIVFALIFVVNRYK